MTQTPALAPGATLPENHSFDITPGSAPPPVVVQQTQVEYTGTIIVGKYTFNVVGVLSAMDMATLQDAQQSGNFLRIMKAVPRLVAREQRQFLLEYLTSDPESDDEKIQLDEVLRALNNGLEQVAARPTNKS